MKKLLILITFMVSLEVSAQKTDYEKIIVHIDSIHNYDFVEKLVSIAWENYPANRILESRKKQADYKVSQAKNSWMNNLNWFSNFNSYNNSQSQNFTIVPNLGMGVSLNVGSIYTLPSKIKIAKEDLKISEYEINTQKLFIRSEVIARYNDMKMNLESFKFQTDAIEDLKTTVTAVKGKFLKGEVSIEEYNKVYVSYITGMERMFTFEADYHKAKAKLEEIIGVHLEEIL